MGTGHGGGYPKLGYRFERESRGKKLFVDEEESELVKRIFRLYVDEGKTFWEISEMFNSEGIQTKYDKVFAEKPSRRKKIPNHWYPTSLGSIITDETYIGKYFYGRNGYRYDRKLGKDVSYVKPRSEWIELPCPRIVDDATFSKAQELIEKNKAMKSNKVTHPFTGLVKCNACGRSYVGYKTCKHTFSYRCGGNSIYKTHVESRCFNKQVSEKYLFEQIWGKMEQIFENPKGTLEDYHKSQERDERIDDYSKEFADLTKKTEKYSNGLKNLYKDIYLCESDFEKEMKQETLKTLERELEALNRRKAELNDRVAKLKRIDDSKDNLGKIVREYRKAFNGLTYENKLELIREFTDRIVVYDGGKIVVNFRFGDHSTDFTHMEFEIRKDSLEKRP